MHTGVAKIPWLSRRNCILMWPILFDSWLLRRNCISKIPLLSRRYCIPMWPIPLIPWLSRRYCIPLWLILLIPWFPRRQHNMMLTTDSSHVYGCSATPKMLIAQDVLLSCLQLLDLSWDVDSETKFWTFGCLIWVSVNVLCFMQLILQCRSAVY